MYEIRYIELKTPNNDGSAWIGNVKLSKSGNTIYFNNHAFKKYNGIQGNYIDIETGEEYWISCVKKNGQDRHWAGKGKITIDRKIVNEYLNIINCRELDKNKYDIREIEDIFPVERIAKLLNNK